MDGNGSGAVSSGSITVDVIAEREGQMLRRHLSDMFRDLDFVKKKYFLTTKLSCTENPFAYADDGNAKRIQLIYKAHIVLQDEYRNPILERTVTATVSGNISNAQGEVVLSLYGRNNNAVLRELSARIVENIRVFLINEG